MNLRSSCGSATCIIELLLFIGRFLRRAATDGVCTQENKNDCHKRECPRLQLRGDEGHATTPFWCFTTCDQAMYPASAMVATPKQMRTIEPDEM